MYLLQLTDIIDSLQTLRLTTVQPLILTLYDQWMWESVAK
jgi:hypothetical protein